MSNINKRQKSGSHLLKGIIEVRIGALIMTG